MITLVQASADLIAAPRPILFLDTCTLLDIVRAPLHGLSLEVRAGLELQASHADASGARWCACAAGAACAGRGAAATGAGPAPGEACCVVAAVTGAGMFGAVPTAAAGAEGRVGMDHSIEVLWEVSERLTGEPFDVAARLGIATP